MDYGLDQSKIKELIMYHVEKNPDLKYYIDDDYIYELVEAIVEGVSVAIRANTREVFDQIERERHNW